MSAGEELEMGRSEVVDRKASGGGRSYIRNIEAYMRVQVT